MRRSQFSYAAQVNTPFKRGLISAVEVLTGRVHLERLYLENQREPRVGESFWAAAIRHLELDIQFDSSVLARAPKTGPLIAIANHPFGVLDGLIISYLMEKIRPDFMILASKVLADTPEIKNYIFSIDLSGRPEAKATNVATRRKALEYLKNGGALIVFPAGLISTAPDKWGGKKALDPTWGTFTAKLIRHSQATVLPIFFHGQNSRIFQIASHINRALRLALIFHEVRKRMGTRLCVAIGDTVSHQSLTSLGGNNAVIKELRRRVYALEMLDGTCEK